MKLKGVLTKKTKEEALSFFEKVIETGINFKLRSKIYSGEKNKSLIKKLLLESPPLIGKSLEKVLIEFNKKFLPYCINFSSSYFLEYPYAGNTIAGIGSDFLKSLLNQNIMTREWSPAGTYLEIQTINWLREIIGYSYKKNPKDIFEVGGIATFGGTLSNTIALYTAFKRVKKFKKENSRKYVFIPKGISHYSIKRSLEWLGIEGEIREIETKNFKYDLNDLFKKLKSCGKNRVCAVIAFAGDVKTGTFDNFKQIYELVKSFDSNIWLHADACHGFCLAFSEKLKKKLQGINLFDSIAADPHKNLFVPYPLSFVIFNNFQMTKLLCEEEGKFLQEEEKYDFGRITPFIGSKSWETLKFWFLLKNFGIKGIGQLIDRLYNLTTYLSSRIASSNNFNLIKRGDFNSVLFSCNNNQIIDKIKKNRVFTLKVTQIYQFGNSAIDKKIEVLKAVVGNPAISKNDIDKFVNYLEKIK